MKTSLISVLLLSAGLAMAGCQQSEPSDDTSAPESPAETAPMAAAPSGKPGDYAYKNADLVPLADEARAAAGELGKRLKEQLVTAMEVEGPTGAARVCSQVAPVIAQQVSDETGFEVGRTSLKTRNPANAPDAWEIESMERFLTSQSNNYSLNDIDRFYPVEDENGVNWFRYAKPIVMGEMCTACHGSNVAPDVQAAIHEIYPEDQATGFEPGDLRGAFTVKKKLSDS